jgi:hypothetical protein
VTDDRIFALIRALLYLIGGTVAVAWGLTLLREQGNSDTHSLEFLERTVGALALFTVAAWLLVTRVVKLDLVLAAFLIPPFVMVLMAWGAWENLAWQEARLAQPDVVETDVVVVSLESLRDPEYPHKVTEDACARVRTQDPRLRLLLKWCGKGAGTLVPGQEVRLRFLPERPEIFDLVIPAEGQWDPDPARAD